MEGDPTKSELPVGIYFNLILRSYSRSAPWLSDSSRRATHVSTSFFSASHEKRAVVVWREVVARPSLNSTITQYDRELPTDFAALRQNVLSGLVYVGEATRTFIEFVEHSEFLKRSRL